jgi:hypothetical protein
MSQAVNCFILSADDSTEVPNLVKKSYSDFRLTIGDWEQLVKMHEVLQGANNSTDVFFSPQEPANIH